MANNEADIVFTGRLDREELKAVYHLADRVYQFIPEADVRGNQHVELGQRFDVVIDVSIPRLIHEGYLSPLRSKGSRVEADLENVTVHLGLL